jgi:hypothetical protein
MLYRTLYQGEPVMKMLGSMNGIDRMQWVPSFCNKFNAATTNNGCNVPLELSDRLGVGVLGREPGLREPSRCLSARSGVPGLEADGGSSSSNYARFHQNRGGRLHRQYLER